jgi:hypothetical protein
MLKYHGTIRKSYWRALMMVMSFSLSQFWAMRYIGKTTMGPISWKVQTYFHSSLDREGSIALKIAHAWVQYFQHFLDRGRLLKPLVHFLYFCRTCLGTWSKNYWADCEKVWFFLNLIFMSVILHYKTFYFGKTCAETWNLSLPKQIKFKKKLTFSRSAQ